MSPIFARSRAVDLPVLGVLAGAIILFITEKLSIDLVALLIVAVLVLSGTITPWKVAGFRQRGHAHGGLHVRAQCRPVAHRGLATLGPRLGARFRKDHTGGLFDPHARGGRLFRLSEQHPIVAGAAADRGADGPQRRHPAIAPVDAVELRGHPGRHHHLIGTSTNLVVSGIAETLGEAPFGCSPSRRWGWCSGRRHRLHGTGGVAAASGW